MIFDDLYKLHLKIFPKDFIKVNDLYQLHLKIFPKDFIKVTKIPPVAILSQPVE